MESNVKPFVKKGEDLRTELAEATCRVASKHGYKGAFIDLELDLWDARRAAASRAPGWGRDATLGAVMA